MFTSQVYTVQILCLSGIMHEIHLAQEVIRKWNQENVRSEGKLYLQIPETSTPGEADVVIALVDNWVGDTRAIDHCIAAGRSVILLFNAFADPGNTIESEHQAVAAFRQRVQSHCRCLDYRGTAQLRQRVEEAIEALIIH